MKYIKTYESVWDWFKPKHTKKPDFEAQLNKFFVEIDNYKEPRMKVYYNRSIERANLYNIPEIFHDEFVILDYLYRLRNWWSTDNPALNKYIINNVKKYALESIVKKMDIDVDNYFILKKALDDRLGLDYKRLSQITDAAMKNSYFLFIKALKNAPDWIRDATKYNL
jgi:hypothetical protein